MSNHMHRGRRRGPVLVILYLRLSDARKEGGTFADRERDLRNHADRRGWSVLRTVIENDEMGEGARKSASAFKRRRIVRADGTAVWRVFRPGFRSILEDLAAGRAHAILAEDLDRAMRDPRDLEDLIDTCQQTGASADSMSGSLRLTNGGTDAEITMARMLVAVANKSSRDTARRVAAGRERKARSGEWGGGKRPFGFLADGVTIDPVEAAEIVKACDGVLADPPIPLRQLAADLNRRGVPTVLGTRWRAENLRDILIRPRNAAISVYKSEAERQREGGARRRAYRPEHELGRASWEPIVPEDVWRAVVAKLTDPSRAVEQPGPAHRWLGSGIYRCVCGAFVEVVATAYRCRDMGEGGRHVARNVRALDALVGDVIAEIMRTSGTDVLTPPVEVGESPRELRAKLDRLRALKKTFSVDHAKGFIDREDMLAGIDALRPQIAECERLLAGQTTRSPFAALVEAEDPLAAWHDLSLGAQRATVQLLIKVTILPALPGRKTFDPATVRIERVKPNANANR